MKILNVVFGAFKKYGGPSTVAYTHLTGFSKLDNELEKNDLKITFLSINDEVKRRKITENIDVIGTKRYPLISFTAEIQSLLDIKKGFDLVHSHSLYDVFPYLLRTPTVLTIHGIPWEEIEFNRGIYSKIALKLRELRIKLYYPKLKNVVAISQYVLEELEYKGFDPSKVVIIENPVSDEFFEVKNREEQMIFYPGSLIPLKNQANFLKAISMIKEEIKNYKIVFAGSKYPEYEQKLRDFVEKNDLNVHFLGKVPYDKMPELYSKASVVVSMSFKETFGMVIAEAMATGTPVLASSIPVFRKNIKDGTTGLLGNPNDPKDIAEKLLILVNDDDLRKRMGRKAKEEAESRWKAELIAKKHLELYLSILEER